MRYLLKMIFNVAVGEADDDGNRVTAKPTPVATVAPVPEGYEAWRLALQSMADSGIPALESAWLASSGVFKARAKEQDGAWWMGLKQRAVKAGLK